MITLDFSVSPHDRRSPFRQVFQTHGLHGPHHWYLQQFGGQWGYVVTDLNHAVVAGQWSRDWQAPDALAALNGALETL